MADLLKKIINVSTRDIADSDKLAQAEALEEAAKEVAGLEGQLLQQAYLLRQQGMQAAKDSGFLVGEKDGIVNIAKNSGESVLKLPRKMIKKFNPDLSRVVESSDGLETGEQTELLKILESYSN